jgi:hypothetical protein
MRDGQISCPPHECLRNLQPWRCQIKRTQPIAECPYPPCNVMPDAPEPIRLLSQRRDLIAINGLNMLTLCHGPFCEPKQTGSSFSLVGTPACHQSDNDIRIRRRANQVEPLNSSREPICLRLGSGTPQPQGFPEESRPSARGSSTLDHRSSSVMDCSRAESIVRGPERSVQTFDGRRSRDPVHARPLSTSVWETAKDDELPLLWGKMVVPPALLDYSPSRH